MVLALVMGAGWLVSWLDPYSLAGRFFSYLLKPAVIGINNVSAQLLNKLDWYVLQYQNLLMPSLLPVILTLIVMGAIGYLAWKRGRLFCNTICPVGTLLGLFSRFSLLKIRFNPETCTRCGKCAGVCKSECIDIKNYSIDYSRCVTCFNCLAVCPESALSMTASKTRSLKMDSTPKTAPVSDGNRRQFLFTSLALLAGSKLMASPKTKTTSNGKELLLNNKEHPVCPPGSGSLERFNNICTACSLCVSACPTHVLQPALTQYGLSGFMQPHMDYLTSFCNFDCNKCGQVCPTGAILPLTTEEKHVTQMGKAVFVRQNCVVYTDETDCGACSEHCPTKAVHMVPYKNGLVIPEVDQDICIGCGACEHPCPVEAPYKAIFVNGNPVQQIAKTPEKGEKKVIDDSEDFPF
jgi:ferredoxin